MAIVESDKIDIEIQEQTKDAGCKYMVLVSFEGPNQSKEIAKVLLTNSKPHIRTTVDTGNVVKDDWFVGNNLNDKIYTGPLNEIKEQLKKDNG